MAAAAASARVAPAGSAGAVRGSAANDAPDSPYGPQERSHQNEPAPAPVPADFEASVPAAAPVPGQDPDRSGAGRLAPNEAGDIAVALSGGGVRAAALSTGVLCFLKELGVATRIKAISCVSGGGYTGGALVNWWRHHNRKAAEQRHDAALELDWMYELFERIVKPGNPLASCDTFCKGFRSSLLWIFVGLKMFVSWLLAVVPFAFLMAEFIAFGGGADRGRDTLLDPAEVDDNALLFVKYFLPSAVGAVILLKLVLACLKGPRQSRHVAKFNDFANAFGYLVVYYTAVASFAYLFYAVINPSHAILGGGSAATWAVVALALLLSLAMRSCGGEGTAVAMEALGIGLIYSYVAALRVQMSESADTDWVTWDGLLCASGVIMGVLYPHVAYMKARNMANCYQYSLGNAYFPPIMGKLKWLQRYPFACFVWSAHIEMPFQDPTLQELRNAELDIKGKRPVDPATIGLVPVPRFMSNVTVNTWRRKVNIQVSHVTVDAKGVPCIRRGWDNGRAPIALDSTGYTRFDESLRNVTCAHGVGPHATEPDAEAAVDSYFAGEGLHLRLSSVVGMSGAAVSGEMGDVVSSWRVMSVVRNIGMTWGRWIDLGKQHSFAARLQETWATCKPCGRRSGTVNTPTDQTVNAAAAGGSVARTVVLQYLVFIVIFAPLALMPVFESSLLAVASFGLGCLFVVTSPWHSRLACLLSFEPSRTIRGKLNQDWWQKEGQTNVSSEALYLSDGGHTENLALLPLLKAQHARIVSIDSSADTKEACRVFLKLVGLARRYLGCQFMPPPHLREKYPDVDLYIFDYLIVRKPRAFHISIRYASGREGELLFLKPRYKRVAQHPDDAHHSNGGGATPGDEERKHDGDDLEDGGGCCKDPSTRTQTLPQHEAEQARRMGPDAAKHYCKTHGVTEDGDGAEIADEDMIGCCCDCCSTSRGCCGGWKWLNTKMCGRFPQVSTLNQFLTSKQKRALHRVAYQCMLDASTEHAAFFREARAAAQAQRTDRGGSYSAYHFGSGAVADDSGNQAAVAGSGSGVRPHDE